MPSAAKTTSGVALVERHLTARLDVAHCAVCLVIAARSPHISSVIRQLRDRGHDIARSCRRCEQCAKTTSHYQVVGARPSTRRARVPDDVRREYLAACGHRDAFTGMPSTKLELDHRTPHREATGDEAVVDARNIAERYQPLTAASNQLKRWACGRCVDDGVRPAFMDIDFWLEAGPERPETCARCPWADPDTWREALHTRLASI